MVVFLYVSYSKYVREDYVVKIGGYGILIVVTGSMEPEIEPKELVLIKEQKQYYQNDIVAYVNTYANLITHRILQINEQDMITKGDANEIADPKTDVRNIQGKVIFHSKILGIFVLYYLKWMIVVYMIIWFVLKVVKEFEL